MKLNACSPPPPEEVERRLSSNKGTRKWKLWFWAKREAKKAWYVSSLVLVTLRDYLAECEIRHNLPQNKAKVVAGGDNEGEDKQQEAQEKAQEEAQEEAQEGERAEEWEEEHQAA